MLSTIQTIIIQFVYVFDSLILALNFPVEIRYISNLNSLDLIEIFLIVL